MNNELIEKFIKDNINFDCKKEYLSSIQVKLNDGKDNMLILQCFDSIMIYINDKYMATYYQAYDRQNNLIWRATSNLD
ncbi:MAG: hypothetical protein MR405_08040 [Mollicutes bacterium]|nr:hypothetical protein [Mollicutes bacterium]